MMNDSNFKEGINFFYKSENKFVYFLPVAVKNSCGRWRIFAWLFETTYLSFFLKH